MTRPNLKNKEDGATTQERPTAVQEQNMMLSNVAFELGGE